MDSLFIVMPAYNEEENIESVVRHWYAVLAGKNEKSRLVVADYGSTDKTHVILENLQKELVQLEILENIQDKQHGPKLLALYDYAIQQRADYIFQTDSDGQTNAEEFDAFWQLRQQYDGIFAYRKVREDGKNRKFVENVVCFLLKLYFGVSIPDANAPFRLMRTETVKKYLYKLPKDYNIPNIMMTTYFAYYNERVLFKTITFKPRQGGKNKMDFSRIFKTGWKALGDFKTLKKDMR